MNYSQLELQRETIFKDAVIKGAEQKAKAIIKRAENDGKQQIKQAMLSCEEADHGLVTARLSQDTAKQMGALSHKARRDLLEYRAQLVEAVFAEIQADLLAFTQQAEYVQWLAAHLAPHKEFLQAAKKAVVYLRKEDMPLVPQLQQLLPGVSFEPDIAIHIGGCKASDGRRLYDETIDAAMKEEKQRFYAESELWI